MNYSKLTSDQQTKIVNYCLSCLNFEDYDEPATIENLFKHFESVLGHDIKRYGYKGAFIGWMQGLTCLLDVEFYYHEIMPILDFWNIDYDEDANDMGIIFFSLVADCFLAIKESRKEPFYKWIGVTFDGLLQAIEDEEYILKEQLLPHKKELLEHFENPLITFNNITNTGGYPYIYESHIMNEVLHEIATETLKDCILDISETYEELYNHEIELLNFNTHTLEWYLN